MGLINLYSVQTYFAYLISNELLDREFRKVFATRKFDMRFVKFGTTLFPNTSNPFIIYQVYEQLLEDAPTNHTRYEDLKQVLRNAVDMKKDISKITLFDEIVLQLTIDNDFFVPIIYVIQVEEDEIIDENDLNGEDVNEHIVLYHQDMLKPPNLSEEIVCGIIDYSMFDVICLYPLDNPF